MARPYEAVYIFDSVLEEAAVTEKLEKFHALIPQSEGVAMDVAHWGKRTLAYPVAGRETGYYVVAKFEATATHLPEFERALRSLMKGFCVTWLFWMRAQDGPDAERQGRGGGGVMARPQKSCAICESGVRVVDFKDERLLARFLTERGKILPSRLSGTCARHQRQLSTAIKRARQVALIPYIKGFTG